MSLATFRSIDRVDNLISAATRFLPDKYVEVEFLPILRLADIEESYASYMDDTAIYGDPTGVVTRAPSASRCIYLEPTVYNP